MNKKFMVVALLAALSTVGYAYDTVGGNVLNLNTTEHGTWNQTTIDKINSNVNSIVSKTDENFNKVQGQLNQKVNKDEVYTKTEVNNTFATKTEFEDFKSELVGEGTGGLLGELNNAIDKKADANNVYSKEEANNKFASKDEINGKVNQSDFDALQGQVNTNRDNIAALDEQLFGTGTTGGVINNINSKNNEQDTAIETNKQNIETNKQNIETNKQNIETNKQNIETNKQNIETNKQNIETNKQNIETNKQNITNLQQTSNNHEARITHLEDRVDRLDEKMNEGLSLMAAMNAVDFQNVQAGEMAIGAGFGHYGNAQSVAVGVAYAPTDNFNVNVKYSATAGNPESFAIGAGASYKFKVGR